MRIKDDIPILGSITVNFLELSAKIFEIYKNVNEVERQKNSPHLGLISHAFKNANHSRFDYLLLQCVISEIIENSFKGTTNAQGNITVNGKKMFGNDIIKSWVLLSNFGHCKNTIGDEKTLLLHSIQNKSFKNELLKTIKEPELKVWSKSVIEEYDYMNFHHIVSIYRIYKILKRRVALKIELLSVYKLLLLPELETSGIANSIQVSQLKTIFNIVRNTAVISLDSRNSSLPINLDILSCILSIDNFENRYQNSTISEILEPMFSVLCDHLYLNIKSQTHQRSYEVKATNTNTFTFPTIVDTAIEKGLSDPTKCHLNHFLRVKLHKKNMVFEALSDATRDALLVKRGLSNIEASMDYNPFTEERVIDFYMTDNFKNSSFPLFVYNVTAIIWRQIIGTAETEYSKTEAIVSIVNEKMNDLAFTQQLKDEFRNPIKEHINKNVRNALIIKNVPAIKNILWSVLKYHIDSKFHIDIDHHYNNAFDYFAVKISDFNSMDNLQKAISVETDQNRKHELNQVKKSANRAYNGTVILCLARIKIFDYSLSPDKRIVTDIDGVVLKFNHEELILELHESKNTAHPVRDAVNDLKNKLVKTLNANSKGFKIRHVKKFGAKIYIRHST